MKHNLSLLAVALVLSAAISGCATGPHPPRGEKPLVRDILCTGYCKCGKCCNWKRNWYFRPIIASGPSKGKPKKVGRTASGKKAKAGQTIAADTNYYPLGTIMFVPGYGYGRVDDRGGAIKGDHIDLFFKNHKQALQWGKQTKSVKIWKP